MCVLVRIRAYVCAYGRERVCVYVHGCIGPTCIHVRARRPTRIIDIRVRQGNKHEISGIACLLTLIISVNVCRLSQVALPP